MCKKVLRIVLKIFEVLGCIVCVIIKALTDQEARRVALRNQKFSREWRLIGNVTWSREGNAFANITYGGYLLITTLLLISRCLNLRTKPNFTEKIFLSVGMLGFFAVGGLVFASLEHVPPDLHDNAITLGCLSFFVAFLFLIDLADPIARYNSTSTQTEEKSNPQHLSMPSTNKISGNKESQPQTVIPLPSPTNIIPSNGSYFSGEQIDIVQTDILPEAEKPVFAKILLPEKLKPIKGHILEPKTLENNLINQNKFRNYKIKKQDHWSDEDNFDHPIRSGFVVRAAKIWERRAKYRSTDLDTIV